MSQPKSNEELIKEFRIVCPHTSPHCTDERCFGACNQDVYVDWVQTALAQKDAEVAEAVNKGYKLAVKHLKEAYDQNGATTTAEAIEWLADNARLFTPKE